MRFLDDGSKVRQPLQWQRVATGQLVAAPGVVAAVQGAPSAPAPALAASWLLPEPRRKRACRASRGSSSGHAPSPCSLALSVQYWFPIEDIRRWLGETEARGADKQTGAAERAGAQGRAGQAASASGMGGGGAVVGRGNWAVASAVLVCGLMRAHQPTAWHVVVAVALSCGGGVEARLLPQRTKCLAPARLQRPASPATRRRTSLPPR